MHECSRLMFSRCCRVRLGSVVWGLIGVLLVSIEDGFLTPELVMVGSVPDNGTRPIGLVEEKDEEKR